MNTLYSLIPEEKLQARLQALAGCLCIPVQLLDAEGNSLQRHGEACSYCRLLREKVFCRTECAKVHLNAGKMAFALGESYIFSCHAELNHIAFSLVGHKQLLGTVITGPFLMDKPDSTLLSTFAEKKHLSPSLCLDLYDELQKLPVIQPSQVQQISRLTDYLFAPLLADERLLMQERQGKLYQQSRINETIQLYKGTPSDVSSTYFYEKEKELLGRVKQGNIQAAKAVLNDLLGFALFVEGQGLTLIRTRAMELTTLLSRVAIEGGAPAERILALNPRYLSQLQEAPNYEDICFSLQEIVENFVSAVSMPGTDGASPVLRKAVAYIAKYFSEPISTQTLATELGISRSYFSALFLKHMAIGFHEYLTRVRIEEAKRLLTATEYPISQIAVSVGYADQSSFTKAFKRVTGVTPYQLR